VVGYDLAAVLLGSMGWLALVTAVTFRLEPEAAKTPVPPPPGRSEVASRGLLTGAFDPQGLLMGSPG
jgi:FAD/FMN-containing dehydrogenase